MATIPTYVREEDWAEEQTREFRRRTRNLVYGTELGEEPAVTRGQSHSSGGTSLTSEQALSQNTPIEEDVARFREATRGLNFGGVGMKEKDEEDGGLGRVPDPVESFRMFVSKLPPIGGQRAESRTGQPTSAFFDDLRARSGTGTRPYAANWFPGQGPETPRGLEALGEIMGIPQQGLFGLVEGWAEGRNPLENAWARMTHTRDSSREGLSGAQLLEKTGVEPGEAVFKGPVTLGPFELSPTDITRRDVLGGALDVTADPLNVTLGQVKAVRGALGALPRVAEEVLPKAGPMARGLLTQAAEGLADTSLPSVQALSRAVKPLVPALSVEDVSKALPEAEVVKARLGVASDALQGLTPGERGKALKELIPELDSLAGEAGVSVKAAPSAGRGFWKEGQDIYDEVDLDLMVEGPRQSVEWLGASLGRAWKQRAVMLAEAQRGGPNRLAEISINHLPADRARELGDVLGQFFPDGWHMAWGKGRGKGLSPATIHIADLGADQTQLKGRLNQVADILQNRGFVVKSKVRQASVRFLAEEEYDGIIQRGPWQGQTSEEFGRGAPRGPQPPTYPGGTGAGAPGTGGGRPTPGGGGAGDAFDYRRMVGPAEAPGSTSEVTPTNPVQRLLEDETGNLRLPTRETPETASIDSGQAQLAKPASLRSSRGKPPQPPIKTSMATETPPTPQGREGFAGNIRLEKYPEEIRHIIQGYADAHADEIETYRRGVRSDEQVMADARALVESAGGDFDKLLKRWKPGDAWNPEEVAALRGVLRAKAEEVLAAQKAIRTGGDTSENLLRLRLALEEHAAVQKVVHGVSAEAGRALRQFRRPVAEALRSGDQVQIERALKYLGGREVNEEIARAFAKLDVDNPDAVYKFIRDVTNPKLNDYIVELFYNSILSGPKTHIVNAVSNALTAIGSPVERVAAAAVDVPLAALQGRPRERYFREATADVFGLMQGIPEGLRAAAYVFKHGFTPEQATKWEFRPRAFGGKAGRVINAPTTALEAADQFFRAINYRAALNAEAYRLARREAASPQVLAERIAELLANPTPELMERAGKIADYRLFRQEPGTFTRQVMRARNAEFLGVQPLRFVIPFLQTPVNLLKFGLERSPLGFLNPKLWQHVASKSPEAADEIARAALGSMLAAGIAWYAADGKITGAAPSNKLDRDRFYREGKQPYSIKIGDRWVSYQRLEPLNQPLSQVAAVVDALKRGDEDAIGKAWQVALTIGKNVTSQTYMTTISDLLNALTEPERYGSNFIDRTVASIVTPYSALLRTGAQMTDTTIREPKGIGEAIAANVPGLSQSVPAKLSAFGEEVQRESPAWLPINVTTEKDTLLNRELSRLDIDVGFVGDSVSGVPLTREEQHEYQRQVGQRIKAALEKAVASQSYQRMSDTAKANALEYVVNQARGAARDAYLSQLLKSVGRDELVKRKRAQEGVAK